MGKGYKAKDKSAKELIANQLELHKELVEKALGEKGPKQFYWQQKLLALLYEPLKDKLFQYNSKLRERHLIFEQESISRRYKRAPVDHSIIDALNQIYKQINDDSEE